MSIDQNYNSPSIGLFAVDFFFFIVLLLVGLRTNNIWPLVACGFQLCSVSFHLAYLLHAEIPSTAYFVGLQLPSCAVIATIGFGCWTSNRRS
jgi:hypothetical protein